MGLLISKFSGMWNNHAFIIKNTLVDNSITDTGESGILASTARPISMFGERWIDKFDWAELEGSIKGMNIEV